MSASFVPILLGTEIASYGMARAFYEEYGVTSVVYGTFPLTPTAHSKFIEVRIDEHLGDEGRLADVLNDHVGLLGDKPGLVVPCGDEYAVALARQKDLLDPAYLAVCPTIDVVERFDDKESFYDLCERMGAPYPKTYIVTGPDTPLELPFGYPVACKPADAISYRNHPFEGQKKAFIIDTPEDLATTVERVYASGYTDHLIVQDFIPGDDGSMRVVNGYARGDGSISLLSIGHPLLEDYSPMAIGNYAAILSYSDKAIYDSVEHLLKDSGWRGFFNMDLKFDPRDNTYKFFELNPRAGRSSFFTTLAGYNLARFAVDDFLLGGAIEPVRATNEVLWVGVPRAIVKKYVEDGPDKERALELMRQGKVGTTLFGAHDNHPKRLFNMAKLWVRYFPEYRRHFGHRDLS